MDAKGEGAPGLASPGGAHLAVAAILAVAAPLLRAAGLARVDAVAAGVAGMLSAPAAARSLARQLCDALPARSVAVASDAATSPCRRAGRWSGGGAGGGDGCGRRGGRFGWRDGPIGWLGGPGWATSAGGIAEANLTSVYTAGGVLAQDQARFDEIRPIWNQQDAADKAAGRAPMTHPPLADRTPWIPSSLYNGMIAPDTKYTIKGALWYQGEADASVAYGPNYTRVFGALIGDWRRQWAQGDFPFLFVQLSSWAPTGDPWSTVRDAQRRTLSLKNTGMAVTLDIGEPKNIHPADKQTVGARLAAAALGGVYGAKVESSSPTFVQATVENGSVRAWFSHAEGLTTKGQPVGGFEVAGYDHKFVPADARIEKNGADETVVATSSAVTHPRYVRYGWTPVVTSYLYNAAGLPTGTFTSEP